MKKIIFLFVIGLLNLPARAIDYNDFPPNLQQILDEKIEELTSTGGVFIAGRIKLGDETHIRSGEDVMVNFQNGVDDPLWVYENGWFLMDRTLPDYYASSRNKLVSRAFGYDPNDTFIKILQGEITYAELVMQKTPEEKLASITGTVLNDHNEPFEGAVVNLSFPGANHGYRSDTGYTFPHDEMKTGPDGRYSFEGLSSSRHYITASASGYAYHQIGLTPQAGETSTEDLKLYRDRGIVIDYVYQADGSRNFTHGRLQTGTIEWVNGQGGIDFADGRVEGYEPNSLRDIEMRQEQNLLKFDIFYVDSVVQNGFYDVGEVNFESIKEADLSSYATAVRPCITGHTYVVRTYEGNYAKFVVRSISGSE